MRRYFSIIFVIIVSVQTIVACNNQKLFHSIVAVEVKDSSPLMGENYYRIYYLGDLVLFQSRYQVDSLFKQWKVDSSSRELVTEIVEASSQWKDKFFVFHRDSSYGYNYDPYRSEENGLRLRIDSALKRIKGENRLDSFLSVSSDSAIWNNKRTELKEVYFLPAKEGMPAGKVLLYYSENLMALRESFNTVVDSAKKMKLYKIEVLTDAFYDEEKKISWPALKTVTEMKEFTVQNPSEIMNYFIRYRRQID